MLEHRACVNVIARFGSGLPPITNIAVEGPLLPIFLRDEREQEGRPILAKGARMISRWHEQLRVNADLEVRLLVIENTPLHSEQQIARARGRVIAIFVDDFDWKLQLELYVRQSVVEVDQWYVHLGFARC